LNGGVLIMIDDVCWKARFTDGIAPKSCARLRALLPYRGVLLHARWSGEACWSPLAAAWPAGESLAEEAATRTATPGEVLLFAGEHSEPELFIAYGANRFACRAGPLAGNPVLRVEDGVARLAEMGRRRLFDGAGKIEIRLSTEGAAT
jgi:hypothetical protein